MTTEYDYFFIEKKHLKENTTFPFHLFVFNPKINKYTLFLNGNKPLTKELESLLDELLDGGGKLAVLKKQRRTFFKAQEINETEVDTKDFTHLHDLEKDRLLFLKLRDLYFEKNGTFSLQSNFEIACEKNDFTNIIQYAQLEIMTFKVTLTPTVSLAVFLAKNFLTKDNNLNRVVATSFLLAKTMNIEETESLADIVCACFLANIGQLHLPLKMIRASQNSYSIKEKKLFEKHTILSNHLIKKSHVQLSERCKKIIQDHHELLNGEGFPAAKAGETIDPLTLIVGAISLIFDYSNGKIDGEKRPLRAIIKAIKNGKFISPDDFGEDLCNHLTYLIALDSKIERKIA